MAMCPDCGNMIMEGDPYCEHCGAHLSWSDEPQSEDAQRSYSRDDLEDILDSMYISSLQKDALRLKLKTFLQARDCTRLSAREGRGEYVFYLTRENGYVRTVDEFYFDPRDDNMERVFCECITNHTHDGLVKSPEFRELIKKTGLEFIGCRGGYRTEYISIIEGFRLVDEIEIIVYFKVSPHRQRNYRLDLEKMELTRPHDYEV